MEFKDTATEHGELWVLHANYKVVCLGTRAECEQYALSHYSLSNDQFDTLTDNIHNQVTSADGAWLDMETWNEKMWNEETRGEEYVWMLMDKIEQLEASRAMWEKRYNRMAAVVESRAILGQESRGA